MGALLGVEAEPSCGIQCDSCGITCERLVYCLCYSVEWRELAYGTRTLVDASGSTAVCALIAS